jgi:hypothetical protein
MGDRMARVRGSLPAKGAGAAILLPVLVAAVSTVVYLRVGWWNMESACSATPPGGSTDWTSVSFGWSWAPPGFTCTYDDGRVWRSLWH